MANRRLVPAHNQQHNVPKLLSEGKHILRALARAYFVTEVAEQTPTTIEAKRRDLGRFFLFYAKLYRHDRPEEWYASVTREFIRQTACDRRGNRSRSGRGCRGPPGAAAPGGRASAPDSPGPW